MTFMRDDVWFDDDNRKAIYNKYVRYFYFFDVLSHPNGYEGIDNGELNLSFSSHELEMILKLRQVFSSGNTASEQMLEGFNHLADWFRRSGDCITNCDYLFVQAYIAFIHEKINNYFSESTLDKITQDNLLALARFSVEMAESYMDQSVHYKHIRPESLALEEYIEERNQSLYELLYSLGSLSSNSKDMLIDVIISTIKKEYLHQPSLDDDGFANLYEYLGYINYIGGDHSLYQMAFDELEKDIHCEVYHLPLPDMVTLLEDDIYEIVDSGDMEDLSDWTTFRKVITGSREFDQLIGEIRRGFMSGVPEYFPE